MNGKNQRIQKSDIIVTFVDWNIYSMFKADSASLVHNMSSIFNPQKVDI